MACARSEEICVSVREGLVMIFSVVRTPLVMVSAVFTFLLFLSERGLAQNTELESLRALVKGMEQQLQQALQRIDQLEKEKGSTYSNASSKSRDRSKRCKARRRRSIQRLAWCSTPSAEISTKPAAILISAAAEMGISASVDPVCQNATFFHRHRMASRSRRRRWITTSLPWNLTAAAAVSSPTSAACQGASP